MAPILSISRDHMRHIRDIISKSVVFIWEEIVDALGQKCVKSCRSGFIFMRFNGLCIALTLSKGLITLKEGLSMERKIYVRDMFGNNFEGSKVFNSKNNYESHLAVVEISELDSSPLVGVQFSQCEAQLGDAVVHAGSFNKSQTKLNFSSGLVGLVGDDVEHEGRILSRFAHCCSEELDLLGAPVFSLNGQLVGVNFSQKEKKDLFFAMDIKQIKMELRILFGPDRKDATKKILVPRTSSTAKKRRMY